VHVLATDSSPGALDVARCNVARLVPESKISLQLGNLLEPVHERPDLVVANLPYLSEAEMDRLPREVSFEPAAALAGGPTGLEIYSGLLKQLELRLWAVPVMIEIGSIQGPALRAMVRENFPNSTVDILSDYAGLDRIAQIWL
jgi:HemK-like putative methylase